MRLRMQQSRWSRKCPASFNLVSETIPASLPATKRVSNVWEAISKTSCILSTCIYHLYLICVHVLLYGSCLCGGPTALLVELTSLRTLEGQLPSPGPEKLPLRLGPRIIVSWFILGKTIALSTNEHVPKINNHYPKQGFMWICETSQFVCSGRKSKEDIESLTW